MYLVTRRDLPIGHQATQAAHAAFDFGVNHPSITRFWHNESQYLVLLTVANEADLISLRDQADRLSIPFSEYHEPDWGNELTSLALAPSEKTRRLTGKLPLLGRRVALEELKVRRNEGFLGDNPFIN